MTSVISILLASLLAAGPYAAETRWRCGAEDSTGFMFRNEDWSSVGFLPEDAMFTLRGSEAGLQLGPTIFVLACEAEGDHLYCHSEGETFVMDRSSGRAAFSSLMGGLIQSNAYVSLFQCLEVAE